MNNITKSWLKKENACIESYSWLDKQKNKNWKTVANKLYKEKRFGWCLWLLYRKTITAKLYIWFFLSLSFALLGLSLYLSSLGLESKSIVAVAAVAAAVAVAVAVVAAAGVVAVVAAVVAVVAVAAAVVVAAAAGVVAVAAAVAVAVAAVAVDGNNNFLVRFGCKLALNEGGKG